MSGSGMIPARPAGMPDAGDHSAGAGKMIGQPAAPRKPKAISRIAVAFALYARAEAIERAVAETRVQPHSRQLPTDTELAEAKFAVRQLRVAAEDFLGVVEAGAGDLSSREPGA